MSHLAFRREGGYTGPMTRSIIIACTYYPSAVTTG